MQTLSIIMPAYNEANTIHHILDKVKAVNLPDGWRKELIIVNDCSSDDTQGTIMGYQKQNPDFPIQYLAHEVNKGKGAALHTGIAAATGDYLIIQDADLEYDPEEYLDLLKPVIDGQADVVYGSRFMGGNAHRILFFWHSLGNKFLTFLSNMMTDLNLTDMETCYKLFRTDIHWLDAHEPGPLLYTDVIAQASDVCPQRNIQSRRLRHPSSLCRPPRATFTFRTGTSKTIWAL